LQAYLWNLNRSDQSQVKKTTCYKLQKGILTIRLALWKVMIYG